MSEVLALPRVVFLGTPQFAVPILEAATHVAQVVLVITSQDKPKGRGREMAEPPVKTAALRLGLEVQQPATLKGRAFAKRIAEYEPDFLVTAAFGKILGRSLLSTPALDALNVHASLLPRHRGAAPANWAILRGDPYAGVCIMRMVEALDAGPVFVSRSLEVGAQETASELLDRLSLLGADALKQVLLNYRQLSPLPQDESLVTWAPSLAKEHGLIDWSGAAVTVHRQVRGLHPWPGAHAMWRGEPLKLHRVSVQKDEGHLAVPGTVIAVSAEGIDVACGNGVVRLLELQAPGRKRLSCAAFLAGAKLHIGEVLVGR